MPVLDGVVHNAGIYRRGPAPFYETLGDLEESFQTNVMGAANVQYVLWRAQRLRDHGTIGVMLTKDIQPMVGRLGVAKVSTLPNQTAYNVSKLALYGLVRSWVSEYMYSYKFLEFFPSPTLDTGMYDPQLGPAVHTLEQTVTPIAERIDRCIRIQ